MSLKAHFALASVALGFFSSREARADDTIDSASAACVSAYEQAQEQRQSGKLLEALRHLQACAADACPAFIRSDCSTWYDDVRAEVPSVVFAARSAGRDLADVRVSLGPRVLASRIDGEALELDPGEYDFQFTAPGMQPLTQHVLISRGERNRLQRAELVPLPRDTLAGSGQASLSPPAQQSWVLPAIFGGVAVLGLSSFGVFGALGRSGESRLETTCSPHCSQDQISSVRTQYVIADVSLAVGVASLGLATYFALSSSSQRRTAQTSAFDVQASAHVAECQLSGGVLKHSRLAACLVACALAAPSACSFHSLEYLGAGGNASETGGTNASGGADAG